MHAIGRERPADVSGFMGLMSKMYRLRGRARKEVPEAAAARSIDARQFLERDRALYQHRWREPGNPENQCIASFTLFHGMDVSRQRVGAR